MINNTEELAQNKLILLYIINKAPSKFTKQGLNNFILERNYMNYFFLQQYLAELIKSKFIFTVSGDEDTFEISRDGKLALDYFEYKLPKKLKEDLAKEFEIRQDIEKKESEVVAEYYPKEDGQYIVNIKLIENEDTLFSLYLNVSTIEQAEHVCESWKTRTDEIYMNVFDMFIDK